MKLEELKELAEWYGYKIIKIVTGRLLIKLNEHTPHGHFQPHKDSNQLDMLKKKFIEENEIHRIVILISDNRNLTAIICFGKAEIWNDDGKDESDAWLKLISNSIKGNK